MSSIHVEDIRKGSHSKMLSSIVLRVPSVSNSLSSPNFIHFMSSSSLCVALFSSLGTKLLWRASHDRLVFAMFQPLYSVIKPSAVYFSSFSRHNSSLAALYINDGNDKAA
ncbi:hypothetical protein AB6A40_000835 [Gnathostoma spinigerum]|uniref:Uncharacterized protein n=1 Tax=Gnathostoma spinigerum TaxID=75299 RepID=A0ABD6E9Q6_9BILA